MFSLGSIYRHACHILNLKSLGGLKLFQSHTVSKTKRSLTSHFQICGCSFNCWVQWSKWLSFIQTSYSCWKITFLRHLSFLFLFEKKYRMLYEAIIANLKLIKVPTLVSITNSSPLTIFLTRRAVLWCASRHCCALKDGASWHLKDFQWHLGRPLSRWKIKVLKCLLSSCLRPWHHSPISTAAAQTIVGFVFNQEMPGVSLRCCSLREANHILPTFWVVMIVYSTLKSCMRAMFLCERSTAAEL